MKALLLILTFIISLSFTQVYGAKTPFEITIVPESQTAKISRISVGPGSVRVFFIVLKNITDNNQKVFESWNSWGYQSISFELIMENGNKYYVKKKNQEFTRNAPSTYLIPPRGFKVYAICLNEEWEGLPKFEKDGKATAKIMAIYDVVKSKESLEFGVWSGKTFSKEITVELNYWENIVEQLNPTECQGGATVSE